MLLMNWDIKNHWITSMVIQSLSSLSNHFSMKFLQSFFESLSSSVLRSRPPGGSVHNILSACFFLHLEYSTMKITSWSVAFGTMAMWFWKHYVLFGDLGVRFFQENSALLQHFVPKQSMMPECSGIWQWSAFTITLLWNILTASVCSCFSSRGAYDSNCIGLILEYSICWQVIIY